MYLASASILVRLYTLYAERVVCIMSVLWCSRSYLVGFRAKHHSLSIYFSFQPVRIGLPPGDNTITSFLLNMTVQSASHMGPTPTSVLVKYGMVYIVVVKSTADCRIGSLAVTEDLSTYQVAVTTLICEALV